MKKITLRSLYLLLASLVMYIQANAQEVKNVDVKTIYINISNKFDSKQMFVVKNGDLEFSVYKKYLSEFNKNDIDTLDLAKTTSAAKEVQLGTLSTLLIKGNAFVYKVNNDLVTQRVFCRYYFNSDKLVFADFFLQKEYSYNDDLFLFRYSKFKVALPNRLNTNK